MEDKENMSIDDFLSEKDRTNLTKSVNSMFFLGDNAVFSDDFPPYTTSKCEECEGVKLINAKELATHKFLSPDNDKYYEKLPETIKAYQRGWNDALDMAVEKSPVVTDPRLKKIEEICRDAFSTPDTQDINLYRAQALANIYAMFIYGLEAPL